MLVYQKVTDIIAIDIMIKLSFKCVIRQPLDFGKQKIRSFRRPGLWLRRCACVGFDMCVMLLRFT